VIGGQIRRLREESTDKWQYAIPAIPALASASRKARLRFGRFGDSLFIRILFSFVEATRQACVSDKLPPLVDNFALPDFSVVFGDAMLIGHDGATGLPPRH
jgi:hypothetical protein